MSAISYPFTLDSIGVLISTDNVAKVYLDRLLTLFSTEIGSRPMQPEYGINLQRFLFENETINVGGINNSLGKSLDAAIRSAVSIWIPDIKVESITYGTPNFEGIATVAIMVRLPNDTTATLDVTTALFLNTGTVTKV